MQLFQELEFLTRKSLFKADLCPNDWLYMGRWFCSRRILDLEFSFTVFPCFARKMQEVRGASLRAMSEVVGTRRWCTSRNLVNKKRRQPLCSGSPTRFRQQETGQVNVYRTTRHHASVSDPVRAIGRMTLTKAWFAVVISCSGWPRRNSAVNWRLSLEYPLIRSTNLLHR